MGVICGIRIKERREGMGWMVAGVCLAPLREQGGQKESAREGRLEEPEWAQRLAALLRAMAGRLKAASQV